MLTRLIYLSRPLAGPRSDRFEAMCDAILTVSRRRNAQASVTGTLLAAPHAFAQVLEGSRVAVSDTFARICRDPRHEAIEIVEMRPVDERVFADWGMSFCELEGASDMLTRRFREDASMNLRGMSPSALLAFMRAVASDQARDNAILGTPRPRSGPPADDIVFVEAAE